jgi:hypothetical protein
MGRIVRLAQLSHAQRHALGLSTCMSVSVVGSSILLLSKLSDGGEMCILLFSFMVLSLSCVACARAWNRWCRLWVGIGKGRASEYAWPS